MKLKSLLLFSLAVASSASAYVLEGQSWTLDRTVVMQMSLNEAHTAFIDGSASFNEVAQAALDIWNLYLPHLHCTAVLNSPVDPTSGDDEMSAFSRRWTGGDDGKGGHSESSNWELGISD